MPPISDALQGITITDDNIALVFEGRFVSFKRHSRQGRDLEALVRRGEAATVEEIREAIDPQKWIAKVTHGRITIDENDQMRLDGEKVDFGLTAAMLDLHTRGLPLDALANFTMSVAKNPDPSIAAGLYPFLMKGKHPITPKGGFLAWKSVRNDFYSHHSGDEDWTAETANHTWSGKGGRVFHPVGGTISLPREQCDPSQGTACSRGLHACSHEYLPGYMGGGNVLLMVEIMPEDVTAFPSSSEAKLRCCRYVVVDHINKDTMKEVSAHLQGGLDAQYEGQGPADEVAEASRTGYDDGHDAGQADRRHDEEYDPTGADWTYPDEYASGRSRAAYLSGYLKGYQEGWDEMDAALKAEAETEDALDQAEDAEADDDQLAEAHAADPAWFDRAIDTEDEAALAGDRDGYRYAMGDTLYDPDYEEGEQWDKVAAASVAIAGYRRGFNLGYERRFREENGE